MDFKLEINCDNDAFHGYLPRYRELKRLAVEAVTRAAIGVKEGKLQDVNGNTCGKFSVTNDVT